MRVGVQTWGSEGDVRPLVALALALDRAGHHVRLSITDIEGGDYSRFLSGSGVELLERRCMGFPEETLKRLGRCSISNMNPLRQLAFVMKELFDPLLPEIMEDSRSLAASSEMVAGHFAVYPLGIRAEKEGIPHVSVTTTPVVLPSAHIPVPGIPWMGSGVNRMLWKLGHLAMNVMGRRVINEVRASEGLPPARNVFGDAVLSKKLNLVEVSPSLLPRPPDWPETTVICGRFRLDDPDTHSGLPGDLMNFIGDGEPPVYVTFGSMMLFELDPAGLAEMICRASRMAGCRTILQCSKLEPGRMVDEGRVYITSGTPHERVFPLCSAVVHHGGAGTSHTASLCGRPSVVVVYGVDQGYWGDLLHGTGLSPRPLSRRNLSASRLADRLKVVLHSSEMKNTANNMASQMRRESGTDTAVRLMERLGSLHS